VKWSSSLGSSYSDDGVFIHQLPDKSFFVAAMSGYADGQLDNTTGPESGAVLFMGLDSLGQMQWGHRTGDPGYARILHGDVMTDGNFVFVGHIYDTVQQVPPWDGDHEFWIVKVSPQGSIIWQHSYNSVDYQDMGQHVAARPDGGCIVSGHRGLNSWDVWVIALNSEGEELWSGIYGGSGPEFGNSIVATPDGGALMAGWTGSNDGDVSTPLNGIFDGWLVKLDALGNIEWDRTYGGSNSDQFQDILALSDGGFLVLGVTNSMDGDINGLHGGSDVWLLHVDDLGNMIGSHCLGGSGNDIARDFMPYQGDFLVAGETYSFNGDVSVSYDLPNSTQNQGDGWLLLVKATGELVWERSVGGSSWDGLRALAVTDDGFVATGVSNSTDHFVPGNVAYGDIWTIRFDRKSTLLAGTLYVDADNSGGLDPDDPKIGGRLVALSSNGEMALSQPNGRYMFAVNGPAEHTITGATIPYYDRDPGTHIVSITGEEPALSGFDFRYTAGAPAQDLQVFLTPVSPFRPGFPVRYDVLCRNVGTTTVDASLSLVLDEGLNFDSTSIATTNISGNMLTWSLGTMLPLQNIQLSVYCTQSVADTLGSPVVSTAEITPITGDLVPEDNTVTTDSQVIGSYDPNDILVDPAAILVQQLDDAILDYTIRFQNTGTDTAFTVAVENILPPNVGLSSFEVIGTSHPVELTYYDFSRKMRFQFNNILLPDSNTNEVLSHGYVRYRLKPLTTLSVGDSVLNTAGIFFDFNAPVITNTAVTTITTDTGAPTLTSDARITLYPNPTIGTVVLRTSGELNGGEVLVRDALGRVVQRGRIGSTEQVLDLSALSGGHYHVIVHHNGAVHRRTLIKQ